jgi:hypothetical protein
MKDLDRSFESALEAVLNAGRQQKDLGGRKDALLRKLVNIGYENQFSPEDRVKARREVKEAVAEYLGQKQEGQLEV